MLRNVELFKKDSWDPLELTFIDVLTADLRKAKDSVVTGTLRGNPWLYDNIAISYNDQTPELMYNTFKNNTGKVQRISNMSSGLTFLPVQYNENIEFMSCDTDCNDKTYSIFTVFINVKNKIWTVTQTKRLYEGNTLDVNSIILFGLGQKKT